MSARTREIWTVTDDGYCAEASDFYDAPMTHPCGKLLSTRYMSVHYRNGDITHWTLQTTCCNRLTVFND